MVSKEFLGNYLRSLVMSPVTLLALRIISSTWRSKVSLLSYNKPNLEVGAPISTKAATITSFKR